jgi:hypothetical protein
MSLLTVLCGGGALASAAAETKDPLIELLRQQTNLTSDAGQRGDQATVDRFTDDHVLFSGGDGEVQRDTKFDTDDQVSRAIKTRTLAFREADRRADISAMRRYADPAALFIDEDGSQNALSDLRSHEEGAMEDWVLHHEGDVAVASYGERLGSGKVLLVEIWTKRGSTWMLLGGQSIPLHRDPPAASLPASALDAFAGVYSAGPGSVVVISRDGDALMSATNGAASTQLKAEGPDRFFTAGLPAGYIRFQTIFSRDAAGKVSGFERTGLHYKRVDAPAESLPVIPIVRGPLKLRDFTVRHRGDVAIAAFFHDRDTAYYGQVLHQTYRSMETWVRRDGAWKMISSQGCQFGGR